MAFAVLLWPTLVLGAPQKDIRGLLTGDKHRRTEALKHDLAHLTPLVVAALRDEKVEVRRQAAIALREMDMAEAEDIENRLRHSLPVSEEEYLAGREPRLSVVSGLVAAAHDTDSRVKYESIRSLSWILRNRAWGVHGEPWGDMAPLQALVDLGPGIVPILISELKANGAPDYRDGVRVSAVEVLSKFREKRILDALLWTIDRENGFVLARAMDAAIVYDDRRVLPTIVANVGKEIGDYGGTPGLWALEKVGGSAIPAMVKGITAARDRRARWTLAYYFGDHPDDRARPALIAALRDPVHDVAVFAAESLAKYPHPKTVAALKKAAKDPYEGVRTAALKSLETIQAAGR